MKPRPRSFGFVFEGIFIQGTVMDAKDKHEVAGLWGEQQYESLTELATISKYSSEQMQKVIDKITNFVNTN